MPWVNTLGVLRKTAKAVSLGGAGKGGDGFRGLLVIGKQIQPLVLAPGMAGQNLCPMQRDTLAERGVGLGEQLSSKIHGIVSTVGPV